MIKAIETLYKGYRFRSRLEARWAVMFDTLGLRWFYEREGYELHGGKWYLPDFEIENDDGRRFFIEVKGDRLEIEREHDDWAWHFDYGAGNLPKFNYSWTDKSTGLILLGDIPEPLHSGVWMHPMVTHYKGLMKDWIRFDRTGVVTGEMESTSHSMENDPWEWRSDPRIGFCAESRFKETHAGYRKARSARFEHGARG